MIRKPDNSTDNVLNANISQRLKKIIVFCLGLLSGDGKDIYLKKPCTWHQIMTRALELLCLRNRKVQISEKILIKKRACHEAVTFALSVSKQILLTHRTACLDRKKREQSQEIMNTTGRINPHEKNHFYR